MRIITIKHLVIFLITSVTIASLQAQSVSLSNLEKTEALVPEGNGVTAKRFTILSVSVDGLENVDYFLVGIGSDLEETDIRSSTIPLEKEAGVYYLKQSDSYYAVDNSTAKLLLSTDDLDTTNKFLTVYAVTKAGTYSNKLSIQAN